MPTFTGKFQFLNPDGSAAQSGPCRLTFEEQTLTLTPGSGAPLAFDLGDIDVFAPGDYELALTLYTGKKILLSQFAKTFQDLVHDLLEAYRKRLVQCLLLEDLEEVARFDGLVQATPGPALRAEVRLYKSNLAILPNAATGFQWRLADIEAVTFDEANYAVTLESAGQRLTITKLAKRSREFKERLDDLIAQLTEKGAQTVHDLFPFLTPDQFSAVAGIVKEGHAVPLAKLRAIQPKTQDALAVNVVDEALKPYFDALMKYSNPDWVYSGFKLLRKDEEQENEKKEASEGKEPSNQNLDAAAPNDESPTLYWFFIPLSTPPGAKNPGNLVAWEATSKSGRATYFFRLAPPESGRLLRDPAESAATLDAAIRNLNHAIVLLNFRREPIYLPDDSLEVQPRFRRYAIACRKIPELRRLRASFVGRAIHSSPEAWQKQFEEILSKM